MVLGPPKRCEIWTLTRTWREDPEIYHPGWGFPWENALQLGFRANHMDENIRTQGFVWICFGGIATDFHGFSWWFKRFVSPWDISEADHFTIIDRSLGQADGNEVESKTKWQVNREVRWGQNNWGCFPAEFHRVWGINLQIFGTVTGMWNNQEEGIRTAVG